MLAISVIFGSDCTFRKFRSGLVSRGGSLSFAWSERVCMRQSCKDSRGEKTTGSYTALVDAGEYRRLYSYAIKAERETV